MFTGIIEETGTVKCLEHSSGGACLDLRGQTVLSDLKVGDSIAVNGVCLTATAVSTQRRSMRSAPIPGLSCPWRVAGVVGATCGGAVTSAGWSGP